MASTGADDVRLSEFSEAEVPRVDLTRLDEGSRIELADSSLRGGNSDNRMPPVLTPGLGSPDLIARIMSPELYRATNAAQFGFPNAQNFPYANERGRPVQGNPNPPAAPERVQIVPYRPGQHTNPVIGDRPPGTRTTPDVRPGNQPIDAAQPARPGHGVFATDKMVQLRLNNRASNHGGTDAVVHIPKGFDPSKPINLVVYNHGHRATVTSAYRDSRLGDAMANAPPNSILVIPEWQAKPGSSTGAQGNFATQNMFRNMLNEIFSKTDGLKGKTVDDISTISIFAHSAGYGPTETQLNKNGLSAKVTSITMLDATYNPHGLDKWLRDNIRELSNGTKQFRSFFNDTTSNSRGQAQRVKDMLRQAGLSPSNVYEDNNGSTLLDSNTIARHPIIFKYSTRTDGNQGPHGAMPALYFGPVLSAAPRRRGP